MKLRQALIEQSPSLALQRAAADEIARLDSLVSGLREVVERCVRVDQHNPYVVRELYPELFKD